MQWINNVLWGYVTFEGRYKAHKYRGSAETISFYAGLSPPELFMTVQMDPSGDPLRATFMFSHNTDAQEDAKKRNVGKHFPDGEWTRFVFFAVGRWMDSWTGGRTRADRWTGGRVGG